MFPVEHVAQVGGLLALLTLFHFIADWFFQTHEGAMAKSVNWEALTWHSMEYTLFFSGLACAASRPPRDVLLYTVLLVFTSHWIEDTYIPVYLWAKYLRRPPELSDVKSEFALPSELERFVAFASTPLGKILVITIDQTVHITFLLPVAVMFLWPGLAQKTWLVGQAAVVLLGLLVLWGRAKIKETL